MKEDSRIPWHKSQRPVSSGPYPRSFPCPGKSTARAFNCDRSARLLARRQHFLLETGGEMIQHGGTHARLPLGNIVMAGSWPAVVPIEKHLKLGASVGLLGLMFENRRRNRLNGTLEALTPDGSFTLAVGHSFGNCPKYIQQRQWQWRVRRGSASSPTPMVREDDRFSPHLIQFLNGADTFFIATPAVGEVGNPVSGHQAAAFGVDASHRGGAPGFVRVIDGRTFEFPDYSGNYLFKTLGNLMVDPRAALLFPDFENYYPHSIHKCRHSQST